MKFTVKFLLLSCFMILTSAAMAEVPDYSLSGILDFFRKEYGNIHFSASDSKLKRSFVGVLLHPTETPSAKAFGSHLHRKITINKRYVRDAMREELGPTVFVLCHEVGHHDGGAPIAGNISVEGQADYYATSECLPTLLTRDYLAPLLQNADLNPKSFEYQSCAKVYSDETRLRICITSLQIALVTIHDRQFAYENIQSASDPRLASFTTPSTLAPFDTLSDHPPAQCSLDTYVAGALHQPRPRCWFNPARPNPL